MVKQVRLGETDLFVHPVGLGANAVGGHNIYPNLDEQQGMDVVKTAIEQGMNMIDTAYSYGNGRSEELIGEIIKRPSLREKTVLATKGAQKTVNGQREIDNSPEFLEQCVDDSLRRLQTDYIDLFYIHRPDESTPKYEAVGTLQRLKEAGKIRAIGISNFSPEQVKEANEDGYVDVIQDEYNLINRQAEQSYFPYAREHNISFVPYFPLVSGLLAGKYDENTTFPDGDIRLNQPYFQGDTFHSYLNKIEQIREIAKSKDADVVHVVLAWYLSRDEIDVVIPGAKRSEQVLNNLKTTEIKLTDKEINVIGKLFESLV